MRVAAVTGEQAAAGFDGFEQGESANRTARAEGFVALARDNERWAVVALDNARRRNADDAAIPAVTIDHDAVGLTQRGITRESFLDCFEDSRVIPRCVMP